MGESRVKNAHHAKKKKKKGKKKKRGLTGGDALDMDMDEDQN